MLMEFPQVIKSEMDFGRPENFGNVDPLAGRESFFSSLQTNALKLGYLIRNGL